MNCTLHRDRRSGAGAIGMALAGVGAAVTLRNGPPEDDAEFDGAATSADT